MIIKNIYLTEQRVFEKPSDTVSRINGYAARYAFCIFKATLGNSPLTEVDYSKCAKVSAILCFFYKGEAA